MTAPEIAAYNGTLADAQRDLAEGLCALFEAQLPQAEAKVWHGHPVWFLNGNPIVGYSLKKAGLEVLFWSGKSFKTEGLRPVGNYQAAGVSIDSNSDVAKASSFMAEAESIQWDYKNLPKLRKLEKLTDF